MPKSKYRIVQETYSGDIVFRLQKRTFLSWNNVYMAWSLENAKDKLKTLLNKNKPKVLVTYDANGEIINFDGEIKVEQFA